jgi:hypothetical protein
MQSDHGRRGLAALLTAGAILGALAGVAQGAVTFQPAAPYAASSPWWIASTDLNANGAPDVVTASVTTNIVSSLLGAGDGTLAAPQNTPAAPSNLNAIAAADLNGDGKGDVAVAQNGNPGSLRVYLGNGDGTLAPSIAYPVGAFPQDVAIGRINGDTAPDIAVANQTSHDISVFLNNGFGGFVAAPGSPIVDPNGNDFFGVEIADFDRDGDTDLARAGINGASPGVTILDGNGTGAFTPRATPGRAPTVQTMVVGDLNGDGFPDIAGSRPANGDVAIIINSAGGLQPATFVDPDGAGGNNGRAAMADLDGDGALDLAVPYVAGSQANKVSILLGRGDGTFVASSAESVSTAPREVTAADLNRDGNPDLASANSGTGNVSVLLAVPPSATVTPSLAFGDQQQGVTSAEQLISVRNDGPPRLRPNGITLGGADPAQFAITTNGCAGASLPAGDACTVGIAFTPVGVGPRSATAAIATNGAGSPHVVELTGTATTPPVPPGPLPGPCANQQDGTAAKDVLTGTGFGDNLFGLDGDDVLNGMDGDDCLIGGPGNDRASGGDGDDTLSGGTGDDRLKGNAGKNRYSGGAGDDKVKAVNGVKEKVNCGGGKHDRATVDPRDKTKHCETVVRKRH